MSGEAVRVDRIDRPTRARQQRCPITIAAPDGGLRRYEPVTVGLPLPRGLTADPQQLHLVDGSGQDTAVQARVLDRWNDGTVRWVLLDFQASCVGTATYYLAPGHGNVPAPNPPVAVTAAGDEVLVHTGAAAFTLRRGCALPFESVRIFSGSPIDWSRGGLIVEDESGVVRKAIVAAIAVEEAGPLRARIRIDAMLQPSWHRDAVGVQATLDFFAGSATVRCTLTIRNTRAAKHPGGVWELGSAGSVYIRDMSLELPFTTPADDWTIRCSPARGVQTEYSRTRLSLYQDSSGGERWASKNHVNRHGKVPNTHRGYRLESGDAASEGLRATPVLVVARGDDEVAVAVRQFWENCPKSLEADGRSITLRLFPRQYADVHELQGGEQKTQSFAIAFARDAIADTALDWCRAPVFASASPAWYCAAQAARYLVPAVNDPNAAYRALVDAGLDGDSSFFAKRETIDEYGWRHFGDFHADHETLHHAGPEPLISHYNNQYDAVAGMTYQFFRTADIRWRKLADELAAHVVDIDIYHTTRDKSAYNGGMFWHTYHYKNAGKSTHRSYPNAPGVCGGGPSNEHNYSTGLMLQYFLTGDLWYRDAVIGLADWVLQMDDGRRTMFRWLTADDTGLASATGDPNYHGPGRGAAYSVLTLLNAHRLSADAAYLHKAEQLIRRCIHPQDDIAALTLLDAERRWYYTVFLQAIGEYLDYKVERQQLDVMYGYAQRSLQHYARWMADHEYPYLDRPEKLEYPTETWAALDMRKSDVFRYAALHSAADRARFVERAEFFFRYSTTTLASMRTRTFARPLVLLLSNGVREAWWSAHPDASAPTSEAALNLGCRQPFVPQKVKAKRRLKYLAGAATALGFALVAIIYAVS